MLISCFLLRFEFSPFRISPFHYFTTLRRFSCSLIFFSVQECCEVCFSAFPSLTLDFRSVSTFSCSPLPLYALPIALLPSLLPVRVVKSGFLISSLFLLAPSWSLLIHSRLLTSFYVFPLSLAVVLLLFSALYVFFLFPNVLIFYFLLPFGVFLLLYPSPLSSFSSTLSFLVYSPSSAFAPI